jgi:hypothetical protein
MQFNACSSRMLTAAWVLLPAGLSRGLALEGGQRVKLDIIGFDACLMSMYEISAAMKPYTNYLLASELLEPGHGWDYRWFGNITTKTTSSTEADVGGYIIDGSVLWLSHCLFWCLCSVTTRHHVILHLQHVMATTSLQPVTFAVPAPLPR